MNKPTEKGVVGAQDGAQRAPGPGRKKMTKKGGELIAEFLVNEKMPYIFGICGLHYFSSNVVAEFFL